MSNKPELKCTCDQTMQPDQYNLIPCPVHGMGAPTTEKQYGAEHAVITDSHLSSKKVEFLSGYRFKCSACGDYSIMHYMRFCPACGVPLMIQSDFVREIIRQGNARGRAKANTTN